MSAPAAYSGDRLPRFQAAARCLSAGPTLRRAGRWCIAFGIIAILFALAIHVAWTAPILWAYAAVLGFGIYLCLPDPRPWALPAAGLVILGLLAIDVYLDYRARIVPEHAFWIAFDVVLAVSRFAAYRGYQRCLAATDAETLAELRRVALAANRADAVNDASVVEMRCGGRRVHLCRLGDCLMLVARHSIGFGIYSKLDTVGVSRRQEIALAAVGKPHPEKPVRVTIAWSGVKVKKRKVFKLERQYIERLRAPGVEISGQAPIAAAPRA